MDQGKIIEFDKPEILLKKQNSLFASLYYKNLKSLVAS
jgi:ABC-type multidrug transport system fused ATPase/permease subunit